MAETGPSLPERTARVTRIARRRPLPGHESEYEALIREMFTAMHGQPGFLGAELIPPADSGGEYQVVVRFDSEAALHGWDISEARETSLTRMRSITDAEPEYRRLTGLEAWFELPVVPASMNPARGRMALVTWLAIFPTASFYLWFVVPELHAIPFLPRTAIVTGLITATMTWLIMPRLTRLLRGWLTRATR